MIEGAVAFGILTEEDLYKIEHITQREFIPSDEDRTIDDLFKVANRYIDIKENIKMDGFGALGEKEEHLIIKCVVILKNLIHDKEEDSNEDEDKNNTTN